MKRLISKKEIQRAYKREDEYYDGDIPDQREKRTEELPDEMFQILGKVISFIENRDEFEGDKDEDK